MTMEAIVLAAGIGHRLWPLTKDRPKSLIDLGGGRSILGMQLTQFRDHPDVASVTIVTGHRADVVDEEIARNWREIASTRYNPFFADAGPLISLWAVRDRLLATDFVVVNGDTLFRQGVISSVLKHSAAGGCYLVASLAQENGPDDVRVRLDADRVIEVGKGLPTADARSAGMLAVTGEASRHSAVDVLDEMLRDPAFLDPAIPWHAWVARLAAEGPGVEALLVEETEWSEIDLHPELDDLRQALASRLPPA